METEEKIKQAKLTKWFKNRFGIFFHIHKRVFDSWFIIRTEKYITGHRGITFFIGRQVINIIYKF